jgi:polyphosphate kinase 2 (PPK2 family)
MMTVARQPLDAKAAPSSQSLQPCTCSMMRSAAMSFLTQKKHEAQATTASSRMSRQESEKELAKLQVELVRLQSWIQAKRA